MTKPTFIPLRADQFRYRLPLNFFDPADYHLRNSVSGMNLLFHIGKIDQNYL